MIRVVNIIEEAKLGGPQIRIASVANSLKGQVDTTVVFPSQNADQFRAKLDEYKIPYKIFNLSRITRELKIALSYIFFSPLEIIKLARYFRKENFDLVHVSGGSWQYKGVIAGKISGLKVVWHLNDTSTPWFIRKTFSLFSVLPEAFIFASSRSQNYYAPLIRKRKKEILIPAPVDTTKFTPEYKSEVSEPILDIVKGKIVIGTTGNINPVKGIETLIRAAEIIKDVVPDLIFVVLGEVYTNQKNYYNQLVSLTKRLSLDNFIFAGGRPDIRPLLSVFDIYACCSLAESSPIAVWEAMAMGKPIVSTDVGDVPKYITDGQNGFITKINDPRRMADGLRALAVDRDLREKFGKRSRGTAVSRLDLSICTEKHLRAYQSIVND